jgi:hypothetical protein
MKNEETKMARAAQIEILHPAFSFFIYRPYARRSARRSGRPASRIFRCAVSMS